MEELVREATRDKKQLDFGFLLNSLAPPPPPPPISLDMFEELFFPASYEAGKSSSKSLDFDQAPPFSWKMSKLDLEKFLIMFGFGFHHF